MDTKPLAGFAVNARLKLLDAIASKLSSVLLDDSLARRENPQAVTALENQIATSSVESVVSEMAYIWFNRLLVLTMLDQAGYNSPKAVTPLDGAVLPEILQRARAGAIDSEIHSEASASRIRGILAGQIPSNSPDMEAYSILLRDVCLAWGKRFPLVFNSNYELADLLTPFELLSSSSIRAMFIGEIKGQYAEEVETIGWLFQFYNSDVKKSAFEKFKSGKKANHEDLVAATQIFTPKAVATTLAQNTVGTLWSVGRPSSNITLKLPDIAIIGSTEIDRHEPEELSVLDPACGSGNLLLSAYELLEEIYLESGHNSDSVPSLILSHNLHGLDIDPRAAALAAFAVWLRASRGLTKQLALQLPHPQIYCLRDSEALNDLARECDDDAMSQRLSLASKAGDLGSLVSFLPSDAIFVRERAESSGLLGTPLLEILPSLELLARRYSAVLANPPYMGPKNMPVHVKQTIENRFIEGRADLYAAFILRCSQLARPEGRFSLVTQYSWVKLKRFSDLRKWLIQATRNQSFQILDSDIFFGVGGFVEKVVFSASLEGTAVARVSFPSSLVEGVREFELSKFSVVEGSPFLFELPEFLVQAMADGPTVGEKTSFNSGLKTGENAVFVRYRWEVSPSVSAKPGSELPSSPQADPRWFPYYKGGPPTRWFSPSLYVVDWEDDGRRIKTGVKADGSKRNFQTMSRDFAFKPFLTYSDISKFAAFRYVPEGYLSDLKTPAIQTLSPMALLALLNSAPVRKIVEASSSSTSIKAGAWERVPILTDLAPLEELGFQAYQYSKNLSDMLELSPDFEIATWLGSSPDSPRRRVRQIQGVRAEYLSKISNLEAEIDAQVSDRYGYPWLNFQTDSEDDSYSEDEDEDVIPENEDVFSSDSDQETLREFISIAVGLKLGSLRRGAGFSELVDPDNIVPLLGTSHFEDDLAYSVSKVLEKALNFRSESLHEGINEILGKPLASWMVKDFYPFHVRMFKNAPIYWMISSPKGHFKALTYIHRLSLDTFATCRTKYVQPLLEKLLSQQKAIGNSDPKRAEMLEVQIQDIRELDGLLYDLILKAPKLDFDEGVVKNHERFASVLRKLK